MLEIASTKRFSKYNTVLTVITIQVNHKKCIKVSFQGILCGNLQRKALEGHVANKIFCGTNLLHCNVFPDIAL